MTIYESIGLFYVVLATAGFTAGLCYVIYRGVLAIKVDMQPERKLVVEL